MHSRLQRLKQTGGARWLGSIQRGIEREALRVTASAQLATTPHPAALGAPMTHPSITTDFSESQLEFITGVHTCVADLIGELEQIHAFAWRSLSHEMLWPMSMPGGLPAEEDVPLAHYGTSHQARIKYLYRLGLKHRYGSRMQCISGMHYNFSMPPKFWDCWQQATDKEPLHKETLHKEITRRTVQDAAYLALARNFLRYHWVLLYLFGASPTVGADLLEAGAPTDLQPWPHGGWYADKATSLRNGSIGYSAASQPDVKLDYNSLDGYCDSLERAIRVPDPRWREIAAAADGRIQLGDGQLQIENELYAPLRLKCIEPELRPLHALRTQGVRHLEIRCIDLNPLSPVGITAEDCHLIDLMLLWCLCLPSEPQTSADRANFLHNNEAIVLHGRDLTTKVHIQNSELPLGDALAEVCDGMRMVADELCADADSCADWRNAADRLRVLCQDPQQTPSGQQMHSLNSQRHGLYEQGLQLANEHRRYWLSRPLSAQQIAAMEELVDNSLLQQQQEEERSANSNFDDWLSRKLAF